MELELKSNRYVISILGHVSVERIYDLYCTMCMGLEIYTIVY